MKKILVVLLFLWSFCWACLASDTQICLFKAKDYHQIKVNKQKKIELPSNGWHEGLFIKDDHLWVNNGQGLNTDVIDINTGERIGQIIVPGTFMEGISSFGDDTYVWSDWYDRAFFFGKLVDNEFVAKKSVKLGKLFPAGVVVAGEDVFVVTWKRGFGTKYYLLRFDRNGTLKDDIAIKHIKEPSQLAWDGKFLWISSWYSKKVYKVDITDYSLKGFFKTGISKTTGIVWDGNVFWVTGTSSDLYTFKIQENL